MVRYGNLSDPIYMQPRIKPTFYFVGIHITKPHRHQQLNHSCDLYFKCFFRHLQCAAHEQSHSSVISFNVMMNMLYCWNITQMAARHGTVVMALHTRELFLKRRHVITEASIVPDPLSSKDLLT
jgi:hypothetical protein